MPLYEEEERQLLRRADTVLNEAAGALAELRNIIGEMRETRRIVQASVEERTQ